MPGEVQISLGMLYTFLFVLARMSGFFIFVPLPGARKTHDVPKIALTVITTILLLPNTTPVAVVPGGLLGLAANIAAEAMAGLAIGLVVSFLLEAFTLAAQIFGFQLGYSYASAVDPSSDADTTVLQLFTQLLTGLLFLSLGGDRLTLLAFGHSFAALPPGKADIQSEAIEAIYRTSAAMFSVGLRLALPVAGLLIVADLALALLGRINAQLQLITLTQPAKVVMGLAALAGLTAVFPPMFQHAARIFFDGMHKLWR